MSIAHDIVMEYDSKDAFCSFSHTVLYFVVLCVLSNFPNNTIRISLMYFRNFVINLCSNKWF